MNMRHLMTVALATCVCAVAQAADAPAAASATKPATAAPAAPAGDQAAIAQYALGYQLGREISASDDRSQSLMEGVRDGRAGTPPKYSEQDMQAALQKLGQQVNEQRAKVAAADAQKQAPINKTFLADNSVKPGVKTTASGLQYKVVSEGTGKQPKATDTVTVNYRGTLIDGTEFDSSYKRGQPATFPVNGVIAGWTEALQLMKEGSKWMLYVPWQLAYGERGSGKLIGPNETLIFEVELIAVMP